MTPARPKAGGSSLALLILAMLFVLIVPLPTFVLDVLLTLNITVSILILLATVHARRPLEFSSFPSVLLFTALLRLSLNVASTRLILLDGDAGSVIRAFGDFVIGGDYIVGVIIFLILLVIQFVVITKGQNRISEVAARFTLDAMPGKQMAIDADLNAGLITNEEAKERRRELTAEAEFYGSMDGAGKFVRGDAIASLIITAINIAGGILIGMMRRGLSLEEALTTYTVLTVGDGLVAQVPALLISVAAGTLVTKSANESYLGDEMRHQLLGNPRALATACGLLLGIAFVPGLPAAPFLVLSGALFLLLRMTRSRIARELSVAAVPAEKKEVPVEELLAVDRLCVEIGYRLLSLADHGKHGGLLEHIASLRKQFAYRTGFVIPPVRVKDNINVDPNGYRILLGGQEVAKGTLRAGQYLAMDPSGTAEPIEGISAVEPAFGLPARWITEAQKERAEVLGYTVIDAASVLVTHLTEVLKKTAGEILSREDVVALVEGVKKRTPAVVEELVPGLLTMGQVQRVLTALLREQVSIRNLDLILETLADAAHDTKDVKALVERVRTKLARAIAEPFLDDGKIKAVTLESGLEKRLTDAISGTAEGTTLPQGFLSRFVDRTAEEMAKVVRSGKNPVILTRAALRPFLSEAIMGAVPHAAVLSYQEAAAAGEVETIGQVRLE